MILSLAPFGGIAAALPAMAAAEADAALQSPDGAGEDPSFASHEERQDDAPGHDRDGGYLLL